MIIEYAVQSELNINDKLGFFFSTKQRFKCAYGGRNGGKSHDVATCTLLRGYVSPLIIVCLREYQKNLEDSVYRLLCNKIREGTQLRDFYDIKSDTIIGKNGTEFIFSGIKNAKNIKSFEGADIAWIEEAQSVSQTSWDILIPTIRKEGSEIWATFNPYDEKDPVYQLFVAKPRINMTTVKINYLENPYCPKIMIEEADYCKRVDYDAYSHIWLGFPQVLSDAVIYKGKYVSEDFTVDYIKGLPYFKGQRIVFHYGMDFGFVHAFAMIESFIHEGTLYVNKEIYMYNLEIDDLNEEVYNHFPHVVDHHVPIYADSARPDMISQLSRARYNRHGKAVRALNVRETVKGKGSVKDGIAFLKNFKKISVHSRCNNTLVEFANYKYVQDKLTGEIKDDIIKANDDAMDALRYSYNPEIEALRRPFFISADTVQALQDFRI